MFLFFTNLYLIVMNLGTCCMWAGYYSHHFARKLGRDCERITRPLKWGMPGFEKTQAQEVTERVKRTFQAAICVPLAIAGSVLCVAFLSLSLCLGKDRLEIVADTKKKEQPLNEKQVSVMSLNACLQEGPFAPLTGGVVPPFDSVGTHPSRVAALAHAVAKRNPDVFLGQEFHDLAAQDSFIEEMKKYGYRYFIIDRGPHPICMNSGLLVASKREIVDTSFISYPLEDRKGLAKGTLQGAIRFSVVDNQGKRLLRLFTTHLNYGQTEDHQNARNRQLKKHVVPLFKEGTPALLAGDFNFDTATDAKKSSGLDGLQNLAEGHVTCTNEGELHLRGKKVPIFREKIDAFIANSARVLFSNFSVEKLQEGGLLLSDHYAVQATATLSS